MEISLNVPAQPAFLHLLRAVASGAAAKRDLGIDELDDFTLAVDEAASRLIMPGSNPTRLFMRVVWDEGALSATLWSDAEEDPWPPPNFEGGLPWRVLQELTDETEFLDENGHPAIAIRKRRAR